MISEICCGRMAISQCAQHGSLYACVNLYYLLQPNRVISATEVCIPQRKWNRSLFRERVLVAAQVGLDSLSAAYGDSASISSCPKSASTKLKKTYPPST